jgi:hypothetical protein
VPPAGPHFGQREPEEAIGRPELGSADRSPIDRKLLAEGEVLESEVMMAAEEEGQDAKEVEQQSDHRARIVAG